MTVRCRHRGDGAADGPHEHVERELRALVAAGRFRLDLAQPMQAGDAEQAGALVERLIAARP